MKACTIYPWPDKIALIDCVMFNAAALEIEYAGIIGKAASATNERLLTIAPWERVSSGRKARDILSGPKRLTAKYCSITSKLLISSYIAIPPFFILTQS